MFGYPQKCICNENFVFKLSFAKERLRLFLQTQALLEVVFSFKNFKNNNEILVLVLKKFKLVFKI